jgi:hypothetical protein
MESMSHTEYITTLRTEAARLAADALAGQTDLLEACHALSSLLTRAELDAGDPDAKAFVLISSETESLPVGAVRERWDPVALEQLQPEIDSAIRWAAPIATPALESVVRRFKA